MANPFATMTAQEMENLRLNDPTKFAELCEQLEKPDPSAKVLNYQNGLLFQGPIPTKE